LSLPYKSEIREFIRPLRQLISPVYRQKAGLAAASLFVQSPLFKDHHQVGCYLPLPHEMDSMPLIAALQKAHKTCYLPLVSLNLADKQLAFALYEENTPLHPNRYHILEPHHSTKIIQATALDMVITPLLAFDETGTRLGTGGGFYDYTFSFLLRTQPHKPLLIGLAYEIQRVDRLTREAFDVPLDGVVTEERIVLF